ncbi:MAG: DUF4935 domain-containing protein [Planctomycetes bacterium]|nr:DUF4935 domain-containing protein [Planctomycetota bacterium]
MLPSAIYFDTNVLIAAGFELNAEWLKPLLAHARGLHIPLIVPDLVRQEWLQFLKEKCNTYLRSLDQLSRLSGELRSHDQPLVLSKEQLLGDVHNTSVRRMKSTFSYCIPTAECDLQVLTQQAIEKFPPFGEADKGFRDTLIVESIIAHMEAQFPNCRAFVVSEDGLFKTGMQERARFANVNIETTEREKVYNLLTDSFDGELKAILKREEARAIEFLKQHETTILEYVRETGVLIEGLLKGQVEALQSAAITRVHEIRPSRVDSVNLLATPADHAIVPIYITVLCSVDVCASRTNPFNRYSVYRFDNPEKVEVDSGVPDHEETMTVEYRHPVQASLHTSGNPGGPYVELKLGDEDWPKDNGDDGGNKDETTEDHR